MIFDIYSKTGIHFTQYFETIESLINSMKRNPDDAYHRRME